MKTVGCSFLLPLSFLLFLVCEPDGKYEVTLTSAQKDKIRMVLKNYPEGCEKRQAAEFLMANIPYHRSYDGNLTNTYREALLNYEHKITTSITHVFDSIWQSINAENTVVPLFSQLDLLDPQFIISEIDFAFQCREKSLWKDSLTFDLFTEYILPYSVANEPVVACRKYLYEKYYPIIEGIHSPKEAFDKIYKYVLRNFKNGTSGFPYRVDPLILDKLMAGTCDDRTLYLTYVARALCIPVAFDYGSYYANYGNTRHSWLAYISPQNEVFVMSQQDSVSYKNGVIDATVFRMNIPFSDENTSYKVDAEKKLPKIYRRSYKTEFPESLTSNKQLPKTFEGFTVKDVSDLYLKNYSLSVDVNKSHTKDIYLFTFLSGRDWTPIAYKLKKASTVVFENIGRDILYLPAEYNNSGIVPFSNPVIVNKDNTYHILNPNFQNNQSVILKRKYLVLALWVHRWQHAIGCRFEASDRKYFDLPYQIDTLFTIQDICFGKQSIPINTNKTYQYVRFVVPENYKPPIAEINCYRKNNISEWQLLDPHIYAVGAKESTFPNLIDKNPLTTVTGIPGYWIGLDFGKKEPVDRIDFLLWNDGNFIEPGDLYELLYYDLGWVSIGRQFAQADSICFDHVPQNALLWLKNHTKGREERVFTYENGKQIWW